MNTYIDADELLTEIDRQKIGYNTDGKHAAEYNTCIKIIDIITSLQQEQPKFKVGDTIHEIGENTVFPMTIERISDGDYVCFTENTQSFINIEFQDDYELVEQEQPEAELEKEIEKQWEKCNPVDEGMGVESAYIHIEAFDIIARHFAEWGAIHLNARKEELI